jgi:hypothetical protein
VRYFVVRRPTATARQVAGRDGDLHTFAPVEARYVRATMLKNSANSGVHIVEVIVK